MKKWCFSALWCRVDTKADNLHSDSSQWRFNMWIWGSYILPHFRLLKNKLGSWYIHFVSVCLLPSLAWTKWLIFAKFGANCTIADQPDLAFFSFLRQVISTWRTQRFIMYKRHSSHLIQCPKTIYGKFFVPYKTTMWMLYDTYIQLSVWWK
jgi:hypothetical protein